MMNLAHFEPMWNDTNNWETALFIICLILELLIDVANLCSKLEKCRCIQFKCTLILPTDELTEGIMCEAEDMLRKVEGWVAFTPYSTCHFIMQFQWWWT